MKQKIYFCLVIIVLTIAGCSSDRTNNKDTDSLLADTALMDTMDMNAAPADTTVMRVDTISHDPD